MGAVEDQIKALQKLREPFPENQIGKNYQKQSVPNVVATTLHQKQYTLIT